MRLSAIFTCTVAATGLSTAAAAPKPNCCKKPVVRKEWRTLSNTEKADYISAVKCLQTKPSQLAHVYAGAQNRFDDYQAVHINLTDLYHFTGPFQPWHRVLVWQYESDLRHLCGYNGGQPFWDWTLDANTQEDFVASPLFDPETGFGGNGPYIDTSAFEQTNVPPKIPGKTGGGCVQDGPFVDMTVAFGPGPSVNANLRCLQRDFSPLLATWTLNATLADWTLDADSYAEFDHRVQGLGIDPDGMTYHAGGHLSVGGDIGEMGNMYSSPGDPLFYLHHANIDRLWNEWQRRDWPARKEEIAGPDTIWAYPFDFFGPVPYQNVTLDTQMDFQELLGHRPWDRFVKIRDVMDIYSGDFCFTYEAVPGIAS